MIVAFSFFHQCFSRFVIVVSIYRLVVLLCFLLIEMKKTKRAASPGKSGKRARTYSTRSKTRGDDSEENELAEGEKGGSKRKLILESGIPRKKDKVSETLCFMCLKHSEISPRVSEASTCSFSNFFTFES